MLLLLACLSPKVSDSPTAESRADSPADSPIDSVDSPTDSRVDSPVDSPEDSPVDSPEDTDPPSWRSLLYPEDWTPEMTYSDGHFLHDFSYAGYHAGEVELPTTLPGSLFPVVDYGADPTGGSDSTAAVQAAIDAAEFAGGGVVSFPAGTFRFDSSLSVNASGVVLDGEGPSSTFLYFTTGTGMAYRSHLNVQGNVQQGSDHLLTVDGENRSKAVVLADVSDLQVGQDVAIGWSISEDFVAEHGMAGIWYSFNGQWKSFFRRSIVAIDSATNTVTLDVPLRYPAKVRDGASLRVETGYITECGVQDLSLSNVNTWETAWAEYQVYVMSLGETKDCWVRNVASWESPLSTDGKGMHLMSGGVEVIDSRRVTVAEVVMANAQNRGTGGNGYLFEISRSSEVLTRDSIGRAGRHNFIQNWDFGTSGCVWLRTESADGRNLLADWDPVGLPAYSEFHHSLAMANLIDQSVATDGWQGVNRQDESSGAGHSVTQSVFWNLSGGGYLRSLQYGDGYVIGTEGMDLHIDPTELDWNQSGEGTAPEDWSEGLELAATLEPQSLYEDQLSRRLGR